MDDISLDIGAGKPVLFVDLSYCIFYRYYATFNWIKKFAKIDVEVEKILENPQFVEKYDKMFEKMLCDAVKLHGLQWRNVCLVKDCLRETIWRNKIFADYKGTRDDRLATFNKEIFKYTYVDLLPRLEEKYGFQSVWHPNLEADDVIAILKTEVRNVAASSQVVIITNDNDYIQLIDDHTVIKNLQGKEIKERVNMPPQTYLKCKIIMGDKSDNIPCIMKKVGPKTAEKLSLDDDKLTKFCEKNPDAKLQLELNKTLIDFSCIPAEYVDALKKRLVIKIDS